MAFETRTWHKRRMIQTHSRMLILCQIFAALERPVVVACVVSLRSLQLKRPAPFLAFNMHEKLYRLVANCRQISAY
jgi:hypothetical protein